MKSTLLRSNHISNIQNTPFSSQFQSSIQDNTSSQEEQYFQSKNKKKFRKRIYKSGKCNQNKASKKNIKLINTVIICVRHQFKQAEYIIQSQITNLNGRFKVQSNEQMEEKVKIMAQKHRNEKMNQKYYKLKKNTVEMNKLGMMMSDNERYGKMIGSRQFNYYGNYMMYENGMGVYGLNY